MDPKPLIGKAAGVVFDDAGEAGGVFDDVALLVAGARDGDGRVEAEAIFAHGFVPVDVAGDDGGVSVKCEACEAGGGGGGDAEEGDEDALRDGRVLIDEDADGAAGAKDAEDFAGGLIFVDGLIAGEAAIAIDERFDAGIFERANEEMERAAVEGVGERGKFPSAHVSGEEEDTFAAGFCGGEIFVAVVDDDGFDAAAVVPGKLRKFTGHPADVADEAAECAAALRVGPIREGEEEIRVGSAAEGRAKDIAEGSEGVAGGAGDGAREKAEEFEDEPGGGELEPGEQAGGL